MNIYNNLRSELIQYLLNEYPDDSGPELLENLAKRFLEQCYNPDLVTRFWDENGKYVQDDIVEETNLRKRKKASLRFCILDDIGDKIQGNKNVKSNDTRISFQDALNKLSSTEFEKLSAAILRIAGCHSYWTTPESHDQGLDAFGYLSYLNSLNSINWLGSKPDVVFLAQAKHYIKEKISSVMIREFVGSASLAKYDIYSVQGEKYKNLKVRPFAPLAILYITTGEVKITAKILAQKSGLVILASDELYQFFNNYWTSKKIKIKHDTEGYKQRLKYEMKDIKVAR